MTSLELIHICLHCYTYPNLKYRIQGKGYNNNNEKGLVSILERIIYHRSESLPPSFFSLNVASIAALTSQNAFHQRMPIVVRRPPGISFTSFTSSTSPASSSAQYFRNSTLHQRMTCT